MKFKNECSKQVFKNMIETYLTVNFDGEHAIKMLAVVLAYYVPCDSSDKVIDLLTELEETIDFLESEGL